MPPVVAALSAIGTAVSTVVTFLGTSSVAAFAARTLLTIGISKLIANRANKVASGSQSSGARFQATPSTLNKLPVVYGKAYMGAKIIDAKISTDQKTMWYVMALSEVTNTMPSQTPDTFTFGNIYLNGRKCTFDGTDTSKVISVETNSDPVQTDDRINGKVYIWRFPNGSSSGIDTGGSNAITLLSDSDIPANLRWNSTLYTTGGQSASMNNTCFIVVKTIYNDDAGITGVPEVTVELTNSRTKPGDVLLDYMYNSRYGSGIAYANIDTTSLTALNTYSDQTITYTPVGGGSATQPRYRINGPVDTGQNCLGNLQDLCDSCDTWLQYSELTGQWKVVINKPYTGTLSSLYDVNSDVLVGGIDINPIDLNATYNVLEVQYPDQNIRDQTNTKFIDLIDYAPQVMSPNEAVNTLIVQYPLVNNYIQTLYLGIRRLLQSREDLVINFRLDYSGIQLEAGDVVRVNLAEYGWVDKLFRVSQVQEQKDENGNLFANVIAFEYNATVYADNALQDFVPADNTGLTDPSISNKPGTPTFSNNPLNTSGAVVSFKMTSTVPTIGTITAMDFNLGNSANAQTHKLYSTVYAGDGTPFSSGQTISIDINDQPKGTYYGTVTARAVNDTGVQSNVSSAFVWDPGLHSNSVGFNNITAAGFGDLMTDTYDLGTNDPFTGYTDLTAGLNSYYEPAVIPAAYSGGGAISSTKYNPYVQGTASTADGFVTTSTGPYAPDLGAGVLIGYNGIQAWWITSVLQPTTAVLTPSSAVYTTHTLSVSTTGSNTHVQICPWAIFTGLTPAGQIELQTYKTEDFYINAGTYPSFQTFTTTNFVSGSANVSLFGFAIRVLSSTDDVYIGQQVTVARQVKL